VHKSLNPSVSKQEASDYAQYIAHPQNLPLVTSTEVQADLDTEYRDYINGGWRLERTETGRQHVVEEDAAMSAYADLLKVGDNPLTVREEDTQKKRYKAYRKWLSGKSLFKHLPTDAEHRDLTQHNHEFYPGL
jgi:hypothetical protein